MLKVRSLRLASALILVIVTATACKNKEDGPPLPSLDTMKFDLGKFGQKEAVLDPKGQPEGKMNFNAAAGRVGLLNTALAVALTPPTLVFAAALSTKPTFADGKWTFDFQAMNGADVFKAVLTAWFDVGASAAWLNLEMKVTCTGCKVPTDNFVWYTGRFNTTGSDGSWQFFNPEIAQDDKTFVSIDYDVTDETHKTLLFTNKRTDGNADFGNTIEYKRDGALGTVKVHDQSETLDYDAAWSFADGSGYLDVPGYNSGMKACWDASQMDTPCPTGP